MTTLAVKALSFLAFAWLYAAPGYEPAIVLITSLIALIVSFAADRRQSSQTQNVSSGAVGIQGGGDVKTGDISSGSKNAK